MMLYKRLRFYPDFKFDLRLHIILLFKNSERGLLPTILRTPDRRERPDTSHLTPKSFLSWLPLGLSHRRPPLRPSCLGPQTMANLGRKGPLLRPHPAVAAQECPTDTALTCQDVTPNPPRTRLKVGQNSHDHKGQQRPREVTY